MTDSLKITSISSDWDSTYRISHCIECHSICELPSSSFKDSLPTMCNRCYKRYWLSKYPDPSTESEIYKFSMRRLHGRTRSIFTQDCNTRITFIGWVMDHYILRCEWCSERYQCSVDDGIPTKRSCCSTCYANLTCADCNILLTDRVALEDIEICTECQFQRWLRDNPDPGLQEDSNQPSVYEVIESEIKCNKMVYNGHRIESMKTYRWRRVWLINTCKLCDEEFRTKYYSPTTCSQCSISNHHVVINNDLVTHIRISSSMFSPHAEHHWMPVTSNSSIEYQYDYNCICASCPKWPLS